MLTEKKFRSLKNEIEKLGYQVYGGGASGLSGERVVWRDSHAFTVDLLDHQITVVNNPSYGQGIHLREVDLGLLADAIEQAARDLFDTIYIHS